LWGGGAGWVGAPDGRDPREPLDLGAVRSIRFLVDLDRRELIPSWWYADPLNPKFGQVEVYRLARIGGVNVDTREVHESRLLRFEGQLVTRRRAITLQGWGESELQRVYADLQQFRGAFAACATLLQDASQGVFAIKDLFTMMAGDRQDALKKRLELMDLARSVGRSVMIDADGERFERVEVGALSGVAEAMQLFLLLLSGASEIPVTLLMGQAPAGLSATGDSDIRTFYDRMRTEQQATLDPQLQRLVRLLLVAQDGPTGGREPASWKITYAPLWQETPGEKADNRLKIAQADQIYLTTGVLLPEEVAISRFGPGDEDRELTIDVSARQAALEAEQAEARTQGAAPAGQGEGPALEAPPAAQDAAPEEETHREPFKAPGLPPPPSNPGGSLWVPPPQRGGPAPGYTGVPEGEPGTGGERT
jgi:phage-related protein (TIGR01555 family)